MSKVQTLINVAEYLSEHPEATDAEISSALNISEAYLAECKRELHGLSLYTWQMLLRKDEVDLLRSRLSMTVSVERGIIDKLRGIYSEEKLGSIRLSSSEDNLTNGYLDIALCSPLKDRSLVDFWLKSLLYDALFTVNKDGDIDYSLASVCESIGGYSSWRVKLKDDLYWSDGKPITSEDVIYTMNRIFAGYDNVPVREIKKTSSSEITFTLRKDNALFFLNIARILIRPAHSQSSYEVTNGPFLLKRSKRVDQYKLYRNRDYYRGGYPRIDQVTLRTFSRPSFAVKAVVEGDVDVFFPKSLLDVRQYTAGIVPHFLFNDSGYWAILINKDSRNLNNENMINRLKGLLDHNTISQCFIRQPPRNVRTKREALSLKVGYIADMPTIEIKSLIRAISCCWGLKPDMAIDVSRDPFDSMRKTVDIILGQFYFGHWYSRLRFYFHSNGECNFFGISDPEIDSLIDKLDVTISIDERKIFGKRILDILNDKNILILLTPCFEYILSNLHIEQSDKLASVSDFIIHLSDIIVDRNNR